MTDGLLLSMLLSVLLLIMAYKFRSLPIAFISSLGFLISGLQVYQETQDMLPMALLFMISFCTFMIPDMKVARK